MTNQAIKETISEGVFLRINKRDSSKKGDRLIYEPEKGLYQIIQFTLGPSTSLMANHIGVGFGIATEEWIECLRNWKRSKVLSLSDCEIIDHNCKLIKLDDKKTWYSLNCEIESLIRSIYDYIELEVLQILERLSSR